jgi:hypothetical protein
MGIQDLRNKVQKESAPAKAFRRPASKGRMLLFSLLATIAARAAILSFLDGSVLVAMGSLAGAAILGALAFDNWQRLDS